MEDGDNKVEIELGKDRKSYAGIPEADFVVSATSWYLIYVHVHVIHIREIRIIAPAIVSTCLDRVLQ